MFSPNLCHSRSWFEKKNYIYNNILVEIEGISEDLLQFRFLLAGDFIINIFYWGIIFRILKSLDFPSIFSTEILFKNLTCQKQFQLGFKIEGNKLLFTSQLHWFSNRKRHFALLPLHFSFQSYINFNLFQFKNSMACCRCALNPVFLFC